ncbi:hypothetical protein [Saccharospirillum impatiens]|uniref:hypothetical protein n=1 Tax=Saccharospirillum impatiens TaxID=169438 RepID=UPI00040E0690|nr:hypothetical protein [Saccharospirillum impatiens]
MSDASASASPQATPTTGDHRLVICSIGRATPASAKSIAIGLGVSVQSVLSAIYQAPSTLVDKVSPEVAEQLQSLLTSLGFETRIDPCSHPLTPANELIDIAGYITDVRAYDHILSALAQFLGTTPEESARLLNTPPGIILGSVSQATLAALRERLGTGIELIESNPQTARYSVFMTDNGTGQSRRTSLELRRRGYQPIADQGCVLIDLDKPRADALWSAFQKANTLRVINQDFLRYNLVLTGPGDGATPGACHVLQEQAGIPEHIIPKLFTNTPITLIEALPSKTLESTLLALTKAGLSVRADLISFMPLGLSITHTREPRQLRQTLHSLGLIDSSRTLPALPFKLPYALPELQARVVRSVLEATGTSTELVEVAS